MSNTPSDAEILALAQQHLKAFAQFSSGEVWFEGEVEFTRAVLEKWGASQPADCTRSHPHEDMSCYCLLRTEIARLANENARLTASQPVVREPQCWCLTCKPMRIDDPSSIRMALCPTCGNKRCPKANDHRNQCSNSNEPGQKGSAYEGCVITQKGGSDA